MTTDVARKHKRMASYPTTSVPLEAVRITAGFWQARMETNRTVTIPYVLKKCDETGRIDNFVKAAGRMQGEFPGGVLQRL